MQWQRTDEHTRFKIDEKWWQRRGLDYRLFLWEQLCPECKEQIPTHIGTQEVDWIDPMTAEVIKTDAILQCLESLCAHKPDYIHAGLPLTMAIFRVLVLNHNRPMSVTELQEHITWKGAELILAALRRAQFELGIFPEWTLAEETSLSAAA